MNIRYSAFILFLVAVIFSSNIIAKDIAIYRWLDENNVVHFSQHQPQGDNYSQLSTFASYKANEKKQLDSSRSASSVDDQVSKFEKEQEAIQANNKIIAAKNCKASKLNIKMLNSFNRVMTTGTDGKNRLLTDKEKEDQLEISKTHVDLYCES